MNSEGVARCLRRQGQVGVRRRLEVFGVNEVMECAAGTPPVGNTITLVSTFR